MCYNFLGLISNAILFRRIINEIHITHNVVAALPAAVRRRNCLRHKP